MNIDLELYKIFYVVAKNKHMTKASEELHISQPAISQSIKKLEDQLGGTLFLRSNKGMELTEEGKMFYEYVKGALELINNAENEFTSFKDLSKGEIKIGCSTTLTKLILMDALKELSEFFLSKGFHLSEESIRSWMIYNGETIKDEVVDGVVDLFKHLKENGKKIVVLTSWFGGTQIPRLKRSGLYD